MKDMREEKYLKYLDLVFADANFYMIIINLSK